MGFIFGGGSKEDDSDDDQRTRRQVADQEARVETQEVAEKKKIDARSRAMRRGRAGMSDMITTEGRDVAQLGNPDMPTQSTLGPRRKI